jgi:hypothetical protein
VMLLQVITFAPLYSLTFNELFNLFMFVIFPPPVFVSSVLIFSFLSSTFL